MKRNSTTRPGAVLGAVCCLAGLSLSPDVTAATIDESQLPSAATNQIDFLRDVKPILDASCLKCHGSAKPKSGFRVDDRNALLKGGDGGVAVIPGQGAKSPLVHYVAGLVEDMEMPPKGKKEMSFGDHGKLLRWLRRLPKPERPDCDRIASDRTANFYKGYVMSRRLNRAEYHNTLRDLFGVELHLGHLLPADGGGGEGFDTSGNALFTSSIHIEKDLAAAEQALEAVFNNPAFEHARTRILVAAPSRKLPQP